MKFWSKLATWKKLILILVLLIVLAAAAFVALVVGFWLRAFFGQVWGICIPQGTRTILFTTIASTRAIRPGPDGRLEEVTVKLPVQADLGPPILPRGCIRDSGWVPLFDWVNEPPPTRATVKPSCHQWTNLQCLDLQTLVARSVIRTEGYIFPLGPSNCLNGRFMAYVPHCRPSDPSSSGLPAVFSVADATFSTINDPIRETRGLILLGQQDYVGIGFDPKPGRSGEAYSDKPGYLSRRGERVADNVYDVLGVTPDLEQVFFEKHEAGATGATVSALWVYRPNDGTSQRLVEWNGDCLRVTSDSQRFGFLEFLPTDQRHRRTIVGVNILNLNGDSLQHFRFKDPIKPCGWPWKAYDWSPDWGIIAYSDETDLVVQSLDGKILGRFILLRVSDVVQFYRSARKHN